MVDVLLITLFYLKLISISVRLVVTLGWCNTVTPVKLKPQKSFSSFLGLILGLWFLLSSFCLQDSDLSVFGVVLYYSLFIIVSPVVAFFSSKYAFDSKFFYSSLEYLCFTYYCMFSLHIIEMSYTIHQTISLRSSSHSILYILLFHSHLYFNCSIFQMYWASQLSPQTSVPLYVL